MKLFARSYDWVIRWSGHRRAPAFLFGLGFLESIIVPVPADVLLMPMVLAQREKAWYFALLTTFASVLGGCFGFMLGAYVFEPLVWPVIEFFGYQAHYRQSVTWFQQWGLWVVFISAFTPIPYKVFTISAGFLAMAFAPFLLASLVGRAGRFFLLTGLLYWGHKHIEPYIIKYIDYIGWAVIALLMLLLITY